MSIRIKGSGQIEGLGAGVTEPGGMSWNTDESTMDLRLNQDVTLQVGEETLYRARNNSGTLITNGTVVMANGTNGNSGRLLISKAIATTAYDPHRVMGIATEDIANNGDGFVTHFGKVRGIQTNGVNYGETWLEGDVLYASQTVAGALTKIRPSIVTGGIISIAIVISPHETNGTLFVRSMIEGHDSAIERYSDIATPTIFISVQDKLRNLEARLAALEP